jgi:hypothetical protein
VGALTVLINAAIRTAGLRRDERGGPASCCRTGCDYSQERAAYALPFPGGLIRRPEVPEPNIGAVEARLLDGPLPRNLGTDTSSRLRSDLSRAVWTVSFERGPAVACFSAGSDPTARHTKSRRET